MTQPPDQPTEQKLKNLNSSFFISCPVCGKKQFSVIQRLDDIPYFGEVLETFASCDACKYKTSDILPLEKKDFPEKQALKVRLEDDLKIRVVKSKSCIIEIPEIKLKIEPGPGSEAFVTNVEGLLERVESKVKTMAAVEPAKTKEFDAVLKKLSEMRNAKKKFTLILRDKSGISAILRK